MSSPSAKARRSFAFELARGLAAVLALGLSPRHVEAQRADRTSTRTGMEDGGPAMGDATEGLRKRLLWPVEGAFLDLQLAGAIGTGIDGPLAFPLQTSGRVGVGYATEPWSFAAGGTAAIGGAFDLAFGIELEVNHFEGPYLDLGVAVTTDGHPVVHGTAGFAIVGVQLVSRFVDGPVSHAVLAVLRWPIGFTRFLGTKHEAAVSNARALNAARTVAPPEPEPTAGQALSQTRAARALSNATTADDEGQLQAAEAALTRALSHSDTTATRLRRADVRERAGRFAEARQDLLYLLTEASVSLDASERRDAEARLARVMASLGWLRLVLPERIESLVVEVDGAPSAALVHGADEAVNPGRHRVAMYVGAALQWETTVDVAPGEVCRLPPAEPAPPPNGPRPRDSAAGDPVIR